MKKTPEEVLIDVYGCNDLEDLKKCFFSDARSLSMITDAMRIYESQPDVKEELFYIQNGYVGNAILWWGIDSKGYTSDITKAGKYPQSVAFAQADMRSEDVAWPCSYIDKCIVAQKLIIDSQYLDYSLKYEGTKK